jgi:hypothetical protein
LPSGEKVGSSSAPGVAVNDGSVHLRVLAREQGGRCIRAPVGTTATPDTAPVRRRSDLEDNHAMINGLKRMGFEVYKTYRVYERPI